jgi:hypothetical protein
MGKLVVIGGGAAGMLASVYAARCGAEVELYEQNEKLGKKLFITGKGRCNLTNASDMEEVFRNVVTNAKFLYSSFYTYTNENAMDFFEDAGLQMKIERGNRVFPVSDHSSDVIRVLKQEMDHAGVRVHLNTKVTGIEERDGEVTAILLDGKRRVSCDACLIATGGISYPSTGSTGDGYRFAQSAGHTVTERIPALVPLEIREDYVKELQGLSLKNVELSIFRGKKKLYSDFGEMMFTHFGITGPLVLSASSIIGKEIQKQELDVVIDLKPAMDIEKLDKRVLRDFSENQNRQFKNSLNKLLPSKVIPVIIRLSEIPEDRKVNEITKEERLRLVHLLKGLPMTACGLRGFQEAIITKGGVSVKEINPSTMESRKTKRLFFAGEVMDLDALTGGYNLQIAWSTAYSAAMGCLDYM